MRSRMLVVLAVVGMTALAGCSSSSGPKTADKDNATPVAMAAPAPMPLAMPAPAAVEPISLPPASVTPKAHAHDKTASAKTHNPTKSVSSDKAVADSGKLSSSSKYVVKKGDNLSKIAKKVYGDGKKFKQIAMANHITDPNHIRVGQVLVIP
jgi:5'-nucleotidase / UDP-sugar diphosphatase